LFVAAKTVVKNSAPTPVGPGDVNVGVCVCYPTGTSAPVYFCLTGILNNNASIVLKVALTAAQALAAPLPSSLPTTIDMWLYKTANDSPSGARQTWTLRSDSTSTSWHFAPITSKQETKKETKQETKKLSRNDGVIPGIMLFQTGTPGTYQFSGWNASVDQYDTVTIPVCPISYEAGATFASLTFVEYDESPTAASYITEALNNAESPIYLYYEGGSNNRRLLKEKAASDYESMVHKNTKCSSCGQSPIIGIKYTCNECIDYDLCSNCEEKKILTIKKGILLCMLC